MQDIIFSTNWNHKLSCKVFSTVRLSNHNRYKLNEVYNIIEKRNASTEVRFQAQIIHIMSMMLKEIPEWLCYLDTGYGSTDFYNIVKKIYKNSNIDINTCLFDVLLLKVI